MRRAGIFRAVSQSSVATGSGSTLTSIQTQIQDTTPALHWIRIDYAAGPGDWLGDYFFRGTTGSCTDPPAAVPELGTSSLLGFGLIAPAIRRPASWTDRRSVIRADSRRRADAGPPETHNPGPPPSPRDPDPRGAANPAETAPAASAPRSAAVCDIHTCRCY